jgi:hypothetical protein
MKRMTGWRECGVCGFWRDDGGCRGDARLWACALAAASGLDVRAASGMGKRKRVADGISRCNQ